MMLLESNYPLEQEFGVRGTQKLSEMCENAVLQHDLGHLEGGQKRCTYARAYELIHEI